MYVCIKAKTSQRIVTYCTMDISKIKGIPRSLQRNIEHTLYDDILYNLLCTVQISPLMPCYDLHVTKLVPR